MILKNVNYKKVKNFDIKKNGIQVIENNLIIEIYNDPFRSIPLFITKDISNISFLNSFRTLSK